MYSKSESFTYYARQYVQHDPLQDNAESGMFRSSKFQHNKMLKVIQKLK